MKLTMMKIEEVISEDRWRGRVETINATFLEIPRGELDILFHLMMFRGQVEIQWQRGHWSRAIGQSKDIQKWDELTDSSWLSASVIVASESTTALIKYILRCWVSYYLTGWYLMSTVSQRKDITNTIQIAGPSRDLSRCPIQSHSLSLPFSIYFVFDCLIFGFIQVNLYSVVTHRSQIVLSWELGTGNETSY